MKASDLARVIGVMVLIVASQAWAECAWVLWEEVKMYPKSGARMSPEWQIGGTFTSLNDCYSGVRSSIETRVSWFQRRGDVTVVRSPDYRPFGRGNCASQQPRKDHDRHETHVHQHRRRFGPFGTDLPLSSRNHGPSPAGKRLI